MWQAITCIIQTKNPNAPGTGHELYYYFFLFGS